MAQRRGLVLLLYCEQIFKLFITLNYLKFLSLDGSPNSNFFILGPPNNFHFENLYYSAIPVFPYMLIPYDFGVRK